jgi:LDH2 family malate/lactate/ureidoglycolate dehydrogenase
MEELELYKHLKRETVEEIVKRSLIKAGCSTKKADVVADNLIEADLRGISSHGIARLQRYLDHIQQGLIDPKSEPRVVHQTGISAVVDGQNGIGQYVAKFATDIAIEKAEENGMAIVVVRNSNHYGIAGYYAEMIMRHGMIGLSSTNTAPLAVPTFGRDALLGTNPIAIAFPADTSEPYMIDMATSVVPRGKLEVYSRNKRPIPRGWCVDETGRATEDPARVLENLKRGAGGGILALGGEGEEFGGHKGYGLAMLVELITAGLSVGRYSGDTYKGAGGICHLFGAIRLDLFGDPKEISKSLTAILMKVKDSERAEGAGEIFLHNEKEHRARKANLRKGTPVDKATYDMLASIAKRYAITVEL